MLTTILFTNSDIPTSNVQESAMSTWANNPLDLPLSAHFYLALLLLNVNIIHCYYLKKFMF